MNCPKSGGRSRRPFSCQGSDSHSSVTIPQDQCALAVTCDTLMKQASETRGGQGYGSQMEGLQVQEYMGESADNVK